MKRILAAAALCLVLAQPALARTAPAAPAHAPEPSLTLYDQPGFRGRSVTLFADNLDLTDTGVVGKARSAQVIGSWRVCSAPGWQGRCSTLSQNVADLGVLNFAGRVVSASLEMGFSQDSWAPDPYAYDVEDYSSPAAFVAQGGSQGYQERQAYQGYPDQGYQYQGPTPGGYGVQPFENDVTASPYPQTYPYTDFGPGGPAFGPASDFDDRPAYPNPYGGR